MNAHDDADLVRELPKFIESLDDFVRYAPRLSLEEIDTALLWCQAAEKAGLLADRCATRERDPKLIELARTALVRLVDTREVLQRERAQRLTAELIAARSATWH